MEIVLAVVLLVALAWFVTAPLRAPRVDAERDDTGEDPLRADLEARKEALYRQIRDAELDREQGKLSPGDWRRIDAELRREAIEVLRAIDAVSG